MKTFFYKLIFSTDYKNSLSLFKHQKIRLYISIQDVMFHIHFTIIKTFQHSFYVPFYILLSKYLNYKIINNPQQTNKYISIKKTQHNVMKWFVSSINMHTFNSRHYIQMIKIMQWWLTISAVSTMYY